MPRRNAKVQVRATHSNVREAERNRRRARMNARQTHPTRVTRSAYRSER